MAFDHEWTRISLWDQARREFVFLGVHSWFQFSVVKALFTSAPEPAIAGCACVAFGFPLGQVFIDQRCQFRFLPSVARQQLEA
jgi:hypothetical protein